MAGSFKRWAVLALLTLVGAVALAGTAQANTVTIGSSLNATFAQTAPSAGGETVTNFILPSPAAAASPTDGTVISWRFVGSSGAGTGLFAPRVLRPTSGTTSTGVGTGTAVTPTAPPAISGPFTTSLPIRRGDLFGVNVPNQGTLGIAPTAGATYLLWNPALTDGASRAPTASIASEAAVSAVVRFCRVPNLKGQSGGAARQALTAANCTIGAVTKSKKRRPTKQVLKQTVKANSSIADTAPVGFTVSAKQKAQRAKPKKKCKKKKRAAAAKKKKCKKKRR